MKRDYDRLYLGSITVRMPESMLRKLDEKCGAGLKYRDRSEVIRSLVSLGMQIESLMEIRKDPKKKTEFERRFAHLLKEKDIEKSLEAMNEDERNGIKFFITHLENQKVQTLIEKIKQS